MALKQILTVEDVTLYTDISTEYDGKKQSFKLTFKILKKTVNDSADQTDIGLLLAEKLIQDGANEILQVQFGTQ